MGNVAQSPTLSPLARPSSLAQRAALKGHEFMSHLDSAGGKNCQFIMRKPHVVSALIPRVCWLLVGVLGGIRWWEAVMPSGCGLIESGAAGLCCNRVWFD